MLSPSSCRNVWDTSRKSLKERCRNPRWRERGGRKTSQITLTSLEKIKNKKGFWSNILKSIFMALVLCQGKTWVGRTLMLDFR